MIPRIIVVTGTPGVGKTVCSQLFAREISARHIDIGGLVREHDLTLGMDSERETSIADIDRLSDLLSVLLEAPRQDCVVEGHLAPYVLDASDIELAYVLRCDPDQLLSRLMKRGFSESKAIENVASEILGVCLWEAVNRFGEDQVAEIDTTDRSPKQVVEEMLNVLNGSSEPVVGGIDWLSRISEQGRLNFFFK